jgi:5'-nucleotidase, C-terminal domain
MTGAQIITVLNEAANTSIAGDSSGSYPYAAGIRYDVDANAEFPNIVFNVEINIRLESDEWTAIDESTTYTVVTNDFISAGRDGYYEFANVHESMIENTYLEYALSFISYAESVGTLISPPLETFSTKSFIAVGGEMTPQEADYQSEEPEPTDDSTAPPTEPADTVHTYPPVIDDPAVQGTSASVLSGAVAVLSTSLASCLLLLPAIVTV